MSANYCNKHSRWRGYSSESCPHCYPPEIEQLEESRDDIEALETKVSKLETENAKLRESLESVMRLNPEGRNYAEHARMYAGAGLKESCHFTFHICDVGADRKAPTG